MPKWPILATVVLLACSDEAAMPPMLGDCANCGTAPISGGGTSGGGGGNADASGAIEAGSDDVNTAPDGLDIVDVGVPPDLDAPLNP